MGMLITCSVHSEGYSDMGAPTSASAIREDTANSVKRVLGDLLAREDKQGGKLVLWIHRPVYPPLLDSIREYCKSRGVRQVSVSAKKNRVTISGL